MDLVYQAALEYMERTLHELSSAVPPPQMVPMGGSFAFRYLEQSVQQAIVQKLARIVSGLYAAGILLEYGFLQEQAALHRMLDEFQEDVAFLAFAVISNNVTQLHQEYLEAFYQEEFDNPNDAVGSRQKRPMIARQKIHAHLARVEGTGLDASRMVEVNRTLSKAYSGYVHGASPHIMELYGGDPPRFHVSGVPPSSLRSDHQDDLWNYFYRGICTFAFAAKALGAENLFEGIREYAKDFAVRSGKEEETKAPPSKPTRRGP